MAFLRDTISMNPAKKTNLFDRTSPPPGTESIETILQSEKVRIERIASNQARSHWYDQDEDEWVLLVEGEAQLQVGTEVIALCRGDALLLKAHQRHRVLSTSEDALWLAIFIKDVVA